MSSRIFLTPLALVVVAFLALLGLGLSRQAGATDTPIADTPAVSRPAPDVEMVGFDGDETSLTSLRGRVVVLNFWASWCEPCRAEAAALESVWRSYESRGVVIFGLSTWDEEKSARAFVERAGVTYRNGLDRRGDAAVEYRLTGIPETFLIDAAGTIVKRWRGPVDATNLAASLEQVTETR